MIGNNKHRLFTRSLLALSLAVTLAGVTSAQTATPRDKLLVTSDWLKTHITDDNLVILHVGDRKEYDTAHIAGARFLPMDGLSTGATGDGGLALEMPSPEALRKQLESLGVSDKSKVIVYFGKGMIPAATRVVFILQTAGFGDRVAMLDGGLPDWERATYPTTTEAPAAKPASLSPLKFQPRVVDAAFVQDHLKAAGYKVIDARASMFYDGVQAGGAPADKQPKGHIPGAVSVPFTAVTGTDLKLKPADQLAAAFKAAGVQTGDRVIVYCHVGWQGTAVIFAARSLGIDAALYDGSFQDWSRRGLPVEAPGAGVSQ